MEFNKKIEFENNCWVSLIENPTMADVSAVSHIGAITKGKFESKNPKKRFESFLTESGDKPSVPLEFVPIKLDVKNGVFYDFNYIDFANKILKYSYIINENNVDCVLTNLRCLLKAGIPLSEIPINTPDEVKDFKIVVGKIPYKVLTHIVWHREVEQNNEAVNGTDFIDFKFPRLCETSRSVNYTPEFWYPTNLSKQNLEQMKHEDKLTTDRVKRMCAYEVGIPAEIANMEYSQRRLVHFAMAGWKQDPNTWDNLFKVRAANNTMNISKIVVDNIKKLIKNE